MDIDSKIQDDLNKLSLRYLDAIDFRINTNQSAFIQYLQFINYKINDIPRKVSFSKQFNYKEDYEQSINLIKEKLEFGKNNIFRHQSRKLFNGKSELDHMFYDFGIHHLHLGVELDSRNGNFIKGTPELLALYINNYEAFFIRVINHNEWHLQDLLKIVHHERPDLLKSRILNNFTGMSFSNDQILALRSNGTSYLLDIDGVCYRPNSFEISGNYTVDIFVKYREILHEIKRVSRLIIKDYFDKEVDSFEENDLELNIYEFDFHNFEYVLINLLSNQDSKNFKIEFRRH